jgi:hypothetical protein
MAREFLGKLVFASAACRRVFVCCAAYSVVLAVSQREVTQTIGIGLAVHASAVPVTQ